MVEPLCAVCGLIADVGTHQYESENWSLHAFVPSLQPAAFDYLIESERTCSDTYHGNRVSMRHFYRVADAACVVARDLDDIKKTLFYGRYCGIPKPASNVSTMNELPFNMHADSITNSKAHAACVDIIHAIVGKFTEAGELLEALVNIANANKGIDKANLREEVGDGLWYDALLLRAIDSNFDDVQRINIAKLRKRFPNAFSEDKANNRNLTAEREVLEQGNLHKTDNKAE